MFIRARKFPPDRVSTLLVRTAPEIHEGAEGKHSFRLGRVSKSHLRPAVPHTPMVRGEGDTEREGEGASQSWQVGARGAGGSPGEKRRRNLDGPEDDAGAVSPRWHLKTRSGPLARTLFWRCSEELFADGEGAPAVPPSSAAIPCVGALTRPPSTVTVPAVQSTPEPEGGGQKSSGNPAISAVQARCTNSKSQTPPYNPICNGFFAKLSPNQHRSPAKPSFPACISPNRLAPPGPPRLRSLGHAVVACDSAGRSPTRFPGAGQEQAELQALLKAAQCVGAVVLTSGSVRSTVKPASALLL